MRATVLQVLTPRLGTAGVTRVSNVIGIAVLILFAYLLEQD